MAPSGGDPVTYWSLMAPPGASPCNLLEPVAAPGAYPEATSSKSLLEPTTITKFPEGTGEAGRVSSTAAAAEG